jgi:hypothetical protein
MPRPRHRFKTATTEDLLALRARLEAGDGEAPKRLHIEAPPKIVSAKRHVDDLIVACQERTSRYAEAERKADMRVTEIATMKIVREIAEVLTADGPQSFRAITAKLSRQPNRVLAVLKDHPEYFVHTGPEKGPGGRWVLVTEPPEPIIVTRQGRVTLSEQPA